MGCHHLQVSTEPSWTIGIEEEYLLVEQESGVLVKEQPSGLIERVAELRHGQVSPELFSSQIEIATGICEDMRHLRADVGLLRLAVTEAADEHGLVPIAASTHPSALPHELQITDKERYHAVTTDLQGVARQLIISGLHVHVGIDDPELRVHLMGQVTYFLPHLLALSTSSPFWQGEDSGLHSYRTAVFRSLPRTGLPPRFASWADYQSQIEALVRAGVIENSTKVWWDIRPSDRYPTLEMRVTDLPTRMEDTVAIAAAYACLLRMLWRLREASHGWRDFGNFLIGENIWRAQRYGVEGQLVDLAGDRLVTVADAVAHMIELIRPDAEALDCVTEMEHLLTICERGTSADRQLATYREALNDGASKQEALTAVVHVLIDDTLAPPPLRTETDQ